MSSSTSTLTDIMAVVERYPAPVPEMQLEQRTQYPLSQLSSLGAAAPFLKEFLGNLLQRGGQSGIYHVQIPVGEQLSRFKNSGAFFGTTTKIGSSSFASQAKLTPIKCNPAMLCVCAMVMVIEKKVGAIHEAQLQIIDFLKQKEKASLLGNLNILNDILCNYKYNNDNETYKTNTHLQAQEIKRDAEKSIALYKEQILKRCSLQKSFHADRDVEKMLNDVQNDFCDYELSLYLYAFSTFLEVVLLENFASDYLKSVVDKIEEYSAECKKLYDTSYESIKKYAESSLQSRGLNLLSKAGKAIGEKAGTFSIMKKTQVDEDLVEKSKALAQKNEERTVKKLGIFSCEHNKYLSPFIENIRRVDFLNNQALDIVVDEENLYVA